MAQKLPSPSGVTNSMPSRSKRGLPSTQSLTWVERFGRRGTEPNELFRSEFGENSCKIQEIKLRKKFKKFRNFAKKIFFQKFCKKNCEHWRTLANICEHLRTFCAVLRNFANFEIKTFFLRLFFKTFLLAVSMDGATGSRRGA